MGMSTNKLQLELHVADFEPIKHYYTLLGFNIAWERPAEGFKGYLVLELEGNTICFWAGNEHVFDQPYFKQFPKNTPRGYGVELVIMLSDIQAYYEKHEAHARVVEPLIQQPWGLWDFRAVDPEGYYLRFTSEHNILDPSNAVK